MLKRVNITAFTPFYLHYLFNQLGFNVFDKLQVPPDLF